MNFSDLVQARRSVREYDLSQPVTDADLKAQQAQMDRRDAVIKQLQADLTKLGDAVHVLYGRVPAPQQQRAGGGPQQQLQRSRRHKRKSDKMTEKSEV